jgi:hypothetical protein
VVKSSKAIMRPASGATAASRNRPILRSRTSSVEPSAISTAE